MIGGVGELSGYVDAWNGGFVREWVVEFKCDLSVLFAGVTHSNDDAVDKTNKVSVVMLSGVEPL